jgi:hypothetical protein
MEILLKKSYSGVICSVCIFSVDVLVLLITRSVLHHIRIDDRNDDVSHRL